MILLGQAERVGLEWPPDPSHTIVPLADGRECIEIGYGAIEGEPLEAPAFHIIMVRTGEIYRCTPDELLPAAT
jgi:hypothetical protein